ncbi:MAG: hypothetical protein ABDH32_03595 [Candidatus Caldarchaeales archaeon]
MASSLTPFLQYVEAEDDSTLEESLLDEWRMRDICIDASQA